MSGSSRYTRAISGEVGEIERRLRALEHNLEKIGARASGNARDAADGLGEAVASALSDWADRFRQSEGSFGSSLGSQSASLGKDAAKFGSVALNRLSSETEEGPLLALAVALGVGILIGMASRRWD